MRALLLALLLGLVACSGHYGQELRRAHDLARGGNLPQAYAELKARTEGQSWDELLVSLDEGALLHRLGEWKASADALNHAIAIADQRETVSISEELFGRAPFRMAKHEKQALHALQALNYLMLGEVDEAVVEARLTDLRQSRLAREEDRAREEERFISGSEVDPAQRAFFEQLLFGRYISALAWELQGREDEAFIDYHRAWQLLEAAPADAKVSRAAITRPLSRLARELERPERSTLDAALPEEPSLGADGELVLVLEAGFGPRVELRGEGRSAGHALVPVPRSSAPGYARVNGVPILPEPLSSIEELALRRGTRGVLLDRERSASIGINTVMALGYVVLFPVAMPVVIRRAHESGVRMGQSWSMLPREFQVARVRLPAGVHQLELPSPEGFVTREIEIRAGRPTLVLGAAP